LDKGHPAVLEANKHREEKVAKPSKRAKKNAVKPEDLVKDETVASFEADHLDGYQQFDIPYPPQYTPEFLEYANCLPERGKQLLWFWEQTEGPADRLKHLQCRDLNLSFGWSTTCETITQRSSAAPRCGCEVQ
jgi:hypothetical protein